MIREDDFADYYMTAPDGEYIQLHHLKCGKSTTLANEVVYAASMASLILTHNFLGCNDDDSFK